MARFVLDFQKNAKQTAILITLVAVGGLVAYLNFLLIPQAGAAIQAMKDASALSAEVKTVSENIARIPVLTKTVDAQDAKLDGYAKLLPMEQEMPSFLENLSVMARAAGVRIVAITPMPGKELGTEKGRIYQEMPIKIDALSGYHELGAFLSELERSDRFMTVVDIEIRGRKGSPKRHDIESVLLTYVLMES